MIKIIFQTDGELQLEALTVLGLSAKPASKSPIGMFGTGLKYAIAVLARENIKTEIFTGGKHWNVVVKPAGFRGATYESIILVNASDSNNIVPLPFTTQLGRNWELWGALRELECNTIDEQGSSYVEEGEEGPSNANSTYIVVHGEEFAEAFNNRFKEIFIDTTIAIRHENTGVQIIDNPSDYLFYRGVRVMKLPETALFTYNILGPAKLTEDRTVPESETMLIQHYIRTALKESTDTTLLERVLNCSENDWESCIGFVIETWNQGGFSSEFKNIGATCSRNSISKKLYEISPAYLQSKEERKEKAKSQHFLKTLLDCIDAEEWDKFKTVAESHASDLSNILSNELDNIDVSE